MTSFAAEITPTLFGQQLDVINTKLRDLAFSVKDYGAVGDGAADDTSAIQGAINAANGALVFIPQGRYRITAKITSSVPVNIRGVGHQSGPGAAEQYEITSSVIIADFANPTVFEITSKRASIFRDFKLDVDPAYRPAASGAGIYLTAPTGATCAKSEIHNVSINNFYQNIKLTRPSYHRITGCYFGSWARDAIYSETDDVAVEGATGFIENNYFFGETGASALNQRSCIYLANGYAVVRANEILGAQKGVMVNIANFPAGFIHIHDNTIEEQYYYGISVQTTGNLAIVSLAVLNNEFSCITNGSHYLGSILIDDNAGTNYITTMYVSGNQSRHQLVGAGKKHFWIGNGQNITIQGNQFEELGAASPIAIQITGSASDAGLASPVLVADNIFKGTFSARYSLASNPSAMIVDYQGLAFADLPANAGNGSHIFCTDGTFANPVADSGTGCFAKRLNGAWRGD